jgi:hypothetical protein
LGPKTGMEDVERRKILPIPWLELWSLGRPARNQSLYRLSYPGDVLITWFYVFYLTQWSIRIGAETWVPLTINQTSTYIYSGDSGYESPLGDRISCRLSVISQSFQADPGTGN